jgi:hypothetical protein
MSHVVAVMPVPAPHAYPQAEIASVIGPILVRDPTRRALLERAVLLVRFRIPAEEQALAELAPAR